jgi:hypothetical protein
MLIAYYEQSELRNPRLPLVAIAHNEAFGSFLSDR